MIQIYDFKQAKHNKKSHNAQGKKPALKKQWYYG